MLSAIIGSAAVENSSANMKKLKYLFGSALAAFMDFGVGVLIAAVVAEFIGVEIPIWFLAIGGVLALLPDFDIALPILTLRAPEGNHRETLFHRPVFLLPLATVATWFIGGEYWALTTFLCVLWHYIHDTKPLSEGGIAWFWPLSHNYWSLMGAEDPKNVNVSTSPAEHNAWIEKNWLRLSPMLIREVSLGVIALVLALGLFSPFL